MKNEFVHSEYEIEGGSSRENTALWIGILGSPVVWLIEMQVSYMLLPWACSTGQHWTLHLASLIFLLAGAAPFWPAWKYWRAAGGKNEPDRESAARGRRQFMGLLGVMTSALFFLLILAQAIPSFILNPCQD